MREVRRRGDCNPRRKWGGSLLRAAYGTEKIRKGGNSNESAGKKIQVRGLRDGSFVHQGRRRYIRMLRQGNEGAGTQTSSFVGLKETGAEMRSAAALRPHAGMPPQIGFAREKHSESASIRQNLRFRVVKRMLNIVNPAQRRAAWLQGIDDFPVPPFVPHA